MKEEKVKLLRAKRDIQATTLDGRNITLKEGDLCVVRDTVDNTTDGLTKLVVVEVKLELKGLPVAVLEKDFDYL